MLPFLPFLLAAALLPVLPPALRRWVPVAVPVLGAAFLVDLPEGHVVQLSLLDHELSPVRVDRLSLLFGYLFHLAAFIAAVYSLHVRDTVQQVGALAYAGSAIGAVFAGDYVTLFVFWELMAISSVALIWARRSERAYRAGLRYLIWQVFSGVLLLVGALVHLHDTGSLEFTFLGLDAPGGWLVFAAFGIKCAFPLAHSWLTDAYPEATPTGTVFLSAFTTKAAVYCLARGFPGTEPLVYIGAVMTCFPIFYAVIENDLRRVLAYSMVNQIGFMVCGIGIGTELAVNGAVAHAFNDVVFKGLLMMSMGAVLHMTGRMNGSDLGGLYKTMPRTTVLCVVGAASISAFPLFSGFVSKSLVMLSAAEEGYTVVWLALLFASAGVFHHAGIKIPFFAFFAHDSGIRTTDPPRNMLAAMTLAAAICIGIGSFPEYLYRLLPFEMDYTPYDATHVIAQLQLLFFSALAFTWLKLSGLYPPELHGINIDFEWTYRRAAPAALRWVGRVVGAADGAVRGWLVAGVRRVIEGVARGYGPHSLAAREWSTTGMVLVVLVLLGSFVAGWS